MLLKLLGCRVIVPSLWHRDVDIFIYVSNGEDLIEINLMRGQTKHDGQYEAETDGAPLHYGSTLVLTVATLFVQGMVGTNSRLVFIEHAIWVLFSLMGPDQVQYLSSLGKCAPFKAFENFSLLKTVDFI